MHTNEGKTKLLEKKIGEKGMARSSNDTQNFTKNKENTSILN